MHWYLILSHAIAIGLGWFGCKRWGAKAAAVETQISGTFGQVKADVKKDL